MGCGCWSQSPDLPQSIRSHQCGEPGRFGAETLALHRRPRHVNLRIVVHTSEAERDYLRLIDSCITQLKAQGTFRTCNESKEEDLVAGAGGEAFAVVVVRDEVDDRAVPCRYLQIVDWCLASFTIWGIVDWCLASFTIRAVPCRYLIGTQSSPPSLRAPALEATQGQMDGFFSQLPYKCHLEEVASLRGGICGRLT